MVWRGQGWEWDSRKRTESPLLQVENTGGQDEPATIYRSSRDGSQASERWWSRSMQGAQEPSRAATDA